MRIAMVFDGLGFGGIERIGINYATILKKLGHDLDIINLKPSDNALETEFPNECNIIHQHLPSICLCERFFPMVKHWWWGKYLFPFVYLGTKVCMQGKRLLSHKKNYDIAIAFSGHYRDLTFVAYNFLRAKKKIAWLHGSLAEYLLISYSYGYLYSKIKNLCVLSENEQDAALRSMRHLGHNLNIHLLLNPVTTKPQHLNSTLIRDLKQEYGDYLVMVGRFNIDKDQGTVIKSLKILKDTYGLSPNLLLIGDGPTRKDCEQLVHQLNLSSSVHFLGTKYDVDNYFSAATLAIHSSPAEGLPTVLLEAMRCNVPILSTQSLPGVPLILQNGECGMMCEVGNAEDMAQKLNTLLSNENLRSHYAKKGTARIQDFSFEEISIKLEKLLDCLD